MGTVTGQQIVNRARRVLADEATGGTRWLDAEMLDHVDDAQRSIVMIKPSANSVTADVTMVAGAKQTLPTGGVMLLNITRNAAGPAITKIEREILDAENRSWYTASASNTAQHYVFDRQQPRTFYLYPPQTSTPGQVEIVYSAVPTVMTTLTSAIALDDLYVPAIVDYILFRAFAKDASLPGALARSQVHKEAFEMAIGGKIQGELSNAASTKV